MPQPLPVPSGGAPLPPILPPVSAAPPPGIPPPAVAPPPALAAAPPEPAPAFELTPDELAAGVVLGDQQVIVPLAAYRPLLDGAVTRGRQEFETLIAPRLAEMQIGTLDELLTALEDAARNPPPAAPPQPPQPETIMPDPIPPVVPTGAPAPAAPAVPAITPPAIAAPTTPTAVAPIVPPAAPVPGAPVVDPTDRYLTEAARKRVAAIRNELTSRATAAEQARVAAEAQATAHQQTIARMQGEELLKITLASSGITEFEFAWHQLQIHIAELTADKTPEGQLKLQAFSKDPKAAVKAWTDEQRKTRPYLFGVQAVPANTSPPAGTQTPPAQTPEQAAAAAANASQFDARRATAAEFKARMTQLGLRA